MSNAPYTRGRSSTLRKGRESENFAGYSITKVVEFRRAVLATDVAANILIRSWDFLRSNQRIKVLAFCIMPDHYHLMLCLMPGNNLSKVMEDCGKFTARELNRALGTTGRFWQNGFYDHRCRNEHETHQLCLYIEHNPVRKRLVEAAELWPYSSAFLENRYLLDRHWWP